MAAWVPYVWCQIHIRWYCPRVPGHPSQCKSYSMHQILSWMISLHLVIESMSTCGVLLPSFTIDESCCWNLKYFVWCFWRWVGSQKLNCLTTVPCMLLYKISWYNEFLDANYYNVLALAKEKKVLLWFKFAWFEGI